MMGGGGHCPETAVCLVGLDKPVNVGTVHLKRSDHCSGDSGLTGQLSELHLRVSKCPGTLFAGTEGWLLMGARRTHCPPLAVRSGHVFFQTPGLIVSTHSVRDGLAGSEVLTSSGSAPSSGSRGGPLPATVPLPLHVRILVVSWQQALRDKGCESKSQGAKEEKLPKRQAPAPRRGREAREAGGTMNVEKTGKGSLPADLAQPRLKPVSEGRLLSQTPSSSPGGGPLDVELRDCSLPVPTPGTPSSQGRCRATGDKQLWPAWAGVEFPRFLSFPQRLSKAG